MGSGNLITFVFVFIHRYELVIFGEGISVIVVDEDERSLMNIILAHRDGVVFP